MSIFAGREGPRYARNRAFDELCRDAEFFYELGKDLGEDPVKLKASELQLPNKSEVFDCAEHVLVAYSSAKNSMKSEHHWFEYLVKGKTIQQLYRMGGRGSKVKIADDLERFSDAILNTAGAERIATLLTL